MPDLRHTRKTLKTVIAALSGVSLLLAAVYISPLVGSAESRRQQLDNLQSELTTKTRQVAPLKDLPQKVVLAGHQINDFYNKRFPTQESEILTELGKLAAANGVIIDQGKYKQKDAGLGGLQQLEIEQSFTGSYTSLAKFINALERSEMFFIINSINLEGQNQGPVKLGIKMETYLRTGQ